MIIFVIGGCRSGKSRYAIELAEKIPGDNKIFIATCLPQDDEMKARVARHQKERNPLWKTLEVPVNLSEAILENSQKNDAILIDCLTLWINNILFQTGVPKHSFGTPEAHIQRLTESLEKAGCPVILVSNEVGAGIVPENQAARLFRDMLGFVNQKIAACSDRVIWMVAGIPVELKKAM